MKVSYDRFNQAEPPTLTLCNPNCIFTEDTGSLSSPVAQLTGAHDIESVLNFNQISELHFSIDRSLIGREVFDGIENRRLVFAEGQGFYIINDVSTTESGSGVAKTVSAISCEAELMRSVIPYIDTETAYSLKDCIDLLRGDFPLWTLPDVNTIPESIAVKNRVFSDVDYTENVYAFIFSDLQVAFGCVFDVDNINRIISCVDATEYIKDVKTFIPASGLANDITITQTLDDVRTALIIRGDNDLVITNINPIGGNTIYDFSYFYDQMPAELSGKVIDWRSDIEDAEDEYQEICFDIASTDENILNHELEIVRLDTILGVYNNLSDTVVAGSDKEYTVKSFNNTLTEVGGNRTECSEYVPAEMNFDQAISNLIDAIDTEMANATESKNNISSELDALNAELATLKDNRDAIINQLSMNNYFTDAEREMLSAYIIEEYWDYEYATSTDSMTSKQLFEQASILYAAGKDHLAEVSSPAVQISGNMKSFPFDKEYEWLASEITLGGNLIAFRLFDGKIVELLPMTITMSYDNKSFEITFANRMFKTDNRTLYEDLFGEVRRSTNAVSREKVASYPVVGTRLNSLRSDAANALNISLDRAITATDNSVSIDGSGYLGIAKSIRDGEVVVDDRQIKITNNSIVFTKNGWETASLAIGPINIDADTVMYGVNAEVIYGTIIAGVKMSIGEEDVPLGDILSGMSAEVETNMNQMNNWMTFDETNGLTIGEYIQDKNATSFYVRHKAREYSAYSTSTNIPIIKISADDATANTKILSAKKRFGVGNFISESSANGLGLKYRTSEG